MICPDVAELINAAQVSIGATGNQGESEEDRRKHLAIAQIHALCAVAAAIAHKDEPPPATERHKIGTTKVRKW